MNNRWTVEQLEAMIELDGGDQRVLPPDELPIVKQQCVCRNGHQPDENGFVYVSPSCMAHGIRSKFVTMSRMTENSARTVGVIHSRNGGN